MWLMTTPNGLEAPRDLREFREPLEILRSWRGHDV